MLGGRFGKQTIDDLVKDIEAFHRKSTNGKPIPVGIVLLYLASQLHQMDAEE